MQRKQTKIVIVRTKRTKKRTNKIKPSEENVSLTYISVLLIGLIFVFCVMIVIAQEKPNPVVLSVLLVGLGVYLSFLSSLFSDWRKEQKGPWKNDSIARYIVWFLVFVFSQVLLIKLLGPLLTRYQYLYITMFITVLLSSYDTWKHKWPSEWATGLQLSLLVIYFVLFMDILYAHWPVDWNIAPGWGYWG